MKDFKHKCDANVEILVKVGFFILHIYWNTQKYGLHVSTYFRPTPDQVYGIRGSAQLQ
jgi:hypothetical protein